MRRTKYKKKGFEGVYYRESDKRRYRGHPDKSFEIIYRNKFGKLTSERVGWQSEGYSAELAREVRSERIRAIRHGDVLIDTEMTFGTAWAHFDKWIQINTKRFSNDQSMYRHHLKEKFAHLKLSQISPVDLESLKSDMFKEGKSPQMVTHALTLISRIYNKMNDLGLWRGANPVKRVKKPQFDSARVRYLSKEEADKFLQVLAVRNTQAHDMALLSLHTGMRLGEIRALRWGCVDIEERLVHVIASGKRETTKNFTSRDAFMSDAVHEMLQRYERPRNQFVFTNKWGRQHSDVPKTFKRVANQMFNEGVTDRRERITFHSLRHTFASWLALRGTPILTIRDLMGHKTLAMTERYAKLSPDARRGAIANVFS
ncbi:tyrosine-type recombinase/integrase [Desulfobaculum bizertense]|uniref:Site-specific recombinase XerD n=1 Tax=Desulfobaculum bizertense DSM 18034 TaxID=1121442 RepID=A0A1T4WX08_9BACT|nr:site-specific integrase [Desulfobaculum bizertense]SKA81769.1 Site-specific recombinase XerD [Desulfobaculum bizertense DSM 18034]